MPLRSKRQEGSNNTAQPYSLQAYQARCSAADEEEEHHTGEGILVGGILVEGNLGEGTLVEGILVEDTLVEGNHLLGTLPEDNLEEEEHRQGVVADYSSSLSPVKPLSLSKNLSLYLI